MRLRITRRPYQGIDATLEPVEGTRHRVPLAVGDEVGLAVLGQGDVTGVVERVDELVQESIRGLAWRVQLRLPDGAIAHGIQRGHARLCFLDPRHRLA